MGSSKISGQGPSQFKPKNKMRRQEMFVRHKKAKENLTRDQRMARKREEAKNPELREKRRQANVPLTIDRKRTWDTASADNESNLGTSVDLERIKRKKLEEDAAAAKAEEEVEDEGSDSETDGADAEEDEDYDSMIDSASEDEEKPEEKSQQKRRLKTPTERATSPTRAVPSITANTFAPEALAAKFPSLFDADRTTNPKILVTTTLNSTLHSEAEQVAQIFPHSLYIPRSAHRYGHKYSLKEIASFASNRQYTAILVLKEDSKKLTGLDVIVLPSGPHFHFSMTNWVEGKKLLGHGKDQGYTPELILSNYRTPLGHLTAQMFRSLFPQKPQLVGRTVVTIHNQRDFLFFRRHRYVFREQKETEKPVVDSEGKEMKGGVEGLKAGLQELGPRFTLKLRRIDKGIQRSSGQEWEWKGKTDRVRTKFQL